MTVKRWTLLAGSAGLVGGLALGVTGLAQAAGTTPSPTPSTGPGHDFRGGPGDGPHGGPGMGDGRGMGRDGFERGPRGLVTAVSGSSVTLRTPDGSRTFGLTGSTTYYDGPTKAAKSALKAGEIVRLRLADPGAASPVATVVTVVPAHLGGFVTKVDGSTITITDESGFTRTIHTSGATTYEKDGAAGKASDITVGALVRATGTVNADGKTLDATTVSLGRPAMPMRPDPRSSAQPGSAPLDPQGPPDGGNA